MYYPPGFHETDNVEIQKIKWLGFLGGALWGISQRPDVPEDIREQAEEIAMNYRQWWDEIGVKHNAKRT